MCPCSSWRQPRFPYTSPRAGSATSSPSGVTRFCSAISSGITHEMSADAAAKLESTREALALGDLKRTHDEAWARRGGGGADGRRGNAPRADEIAVAVEGQMSGRDRDEAKRLRLYIMYC